MGDGQDDQLPPGVRLVSFNAAQGGEDDGDGKDNGNQRPQATSMIALALSDWTEARETLARLRAELESSREDVRRAVDYARELERECDRLADVVNRHNDELQEREKKLARARGHHRELREQYDQVLARLEAMSALRGRYHLERGRREQAQEEIDALRDENQDLHRQLEALSEALEEAQRQGFRAELGPLVIEYLRHRD